MLERIQEHQTALYWMAGISLFAFLATLALVPWVVLRIPADYFAGRKRARHHRLRRRSFAAWLLLQCAKNVLGAVFVLAGLAMLVLPGQGLLTILLGLALMSFPGKYRLERWIVSRGPALRFVNRFRRRRGRPELVLKEGSRLNRAT